LRTKSDLFTRELDFFEAGLFVLESRGALVRSKVARYVGEAAEGFRISR